MSNSGLSCKTFQVIQSNSLNLLAIIVDKATEYHNKLMKEVFGDINPMELDRTDPKKAKELFNLVGKKMKERYPSI